MRFAALLALAACFSPDLSDGVVHCGPLPAPCPPGFECMADGFCWRPHPPEVDDAPTVVRADAPLPRIDAPLPPLDAPPKVTECNDGIDNDCDGLIDMDDPGCTSPEDESEHGTTQCDDGIDNDGDGKIDFRVNDKCGPRENKCRSPLDDDESE